MVNYVEKNAVITHIRAHFLPAANVLKWIFRTVTLNLAGPDLC